jgi:fatty-acid desaturase
MARILAEAKTTIDRNVATVDVREVKTAAVTAPRGEREDIAAQREMIRVWSNGLDWPVIGWIGFLHVAALAAPLCFTWVGLWTFCILSWVTGSLGVCLGYHRLLTHSSFQTYPWVRHLFGLLGTLAGEGPPITWVSVHRQHHRFSDKQGDPHSPHDGGWWSHVLWMFPRPNDPKWQEMLQTYGKDVLKDRFFRLLDKTFLLWHLGLGMILLGVGWLCWDLRTGISLLVWACSCDWFTCCTSPGRSTRPRIYGATATMKRATTAAISGGLAFWPSAKVGTTTTTPSRAARRTAIAGGKST